MKKTFDKLAKLVGAKNAYLWMREAGKIGDDFIEELSFEELEEIFGREGEEINNSQKLAIVELMAQKAKSAKNYARMHVLCLKNGNQDEADKFLEKAKISATLDDWAWMYQAYEFRVIRDNEHAKVFKTAKEMIIKEVLNKPMLAS